MMKTERDEEVFHSVYLVQIVAFSFLHLVFYRLCSSHAVL